MPIIQDIAARVRYTATANQTVFDIPFEFLSGNDIRVYVGGILQNAASYVVTGENTTGGGTLQMAAGVPANAEVVILCDTPVARLSDFPNAGAFQVSQLEAELDRITIFNRELETRVTRTLRLSDADLPEALPELPSKTARAGKYFGFDANGNPTVYAGLAGDMTVGDMLKSVYDTDNDGVVDAAEIANSVAWANVAGKPATFTATAHTHTYAEIVESAAVGAPTLVTALAGKANASHTHTIANVTGLQTALDGKAETSHTHTASSITDFGEAVDDRLNLTLKAGFNTQLVYDDTANTMTINFISGAGAGADGMSKAIYDTNNDGKVDVAAFADGAPWAGITNKPAGFTPAAHTHATSDVTGLDSALAGKASSTHTHVVADISDFSAGTKGLSGLSLTAGDLVYASGANQLARLGPGSAGQVLGLSGGVPAWVTPAQQIASNEKLIFVTTGRDYTPSTGVVAVEFTLVGAGGGSGGVSLASAATAQISATGGGGAGGYLQFVLSGADLVESGAFRPLRVVVGAAGAGGTVANPGGAGGATTLAYVATPTTIFASAGGGSGSPGQTAVGNALGGAGGTNTFTAPVVAGNVVNINGAPGKAGSSIYVSTAANVGLTLGGEGGDSVVGAGGTGTGTISAASANVASVAVSPAAGQYGSGASGAAVTRKATAALASPGAAGAQGLCIIREIYG